MSDSMTNVQTNADDATDSVDDMNDSFDGVNQGAMWSSQGVMGLASTLRMGISDYERYEMTQMRIQSAQLTIQKATLSYDEAVQTLTKDQDKATAAQEAYNAAVDKYGANSPQAVKALQNYDAAIQTVQDQTAKVSNAQQQLTVDQDRLTFYQERSTLSMVSMGLQLPMAAASLTQMGAALGGVGIAGVAAGAAVAGVVVAGALLVGTGISLYQAHQQGESYIQTYSRWAANIHQTMPGITGDVVAAAGMVSAGWMQMGQDIYTKAAPAIGSAYDSLKAFGTMMTTTGPGGIFAAGGHAGIDFSKMLGLSGLGADASSMLAPLQTGLTNTFKSLFDTGSQVSTAFQQGVGNLQQMWYNVWSPSGSGLGGYKNVSAMLEDAFTGPGGLTQALQTQFMGAFQNAAVPVTALAAGVESIVTAIGKLPGVQTTLDALKSAFNEVDTVVQGLVGDVAAFVGNLANIPKEVDSTIKVITDAAISAITQVINLLAQVVDKVVTVTVNFLQSGGAGPSGGFGGGIPVYQYGGPIPETGIYHLEAGEYVVPANQAHAMTAPTPAASPAIPAQPPTSLNTTTTLQLDGQVLTSVTQRHLVQRRLFTTSYRAAHRYQ